MNSPEDYNRELIQNPQISEIKRVTWWGLLINVGLSGLKFVVGIIGSSQAVVADAVHSLSDLSTDFAIIFGVRFWSAPPDEKHPYGHGRIETLVTLGIGIILASVAVGIGQNALFTIRGVHIQQPGWIAITGPLISIIVKEMLFRWTRKVGRQAKSPAVIANAWHHRSDALSSVPVLLAVLAAEISPELAFIDHVGAFIVSLFILKVAWDTARPALAELSGQSADPVTRQRITEIVSAIEGVKGLHAVRTRQLGSAVYVDLHILISGSITVKNGHDISEVVKSELIAREPAITDVVVHIEPTGEA
ncbi:cation diffusion facilitator family transporter [bacterium]|nr:cation diffusion facilitator family transporter [bacterium]MBU1882101.1 cation diffusion facilitator family transporter [bacterium]